MKKIWLGLVALCALLPSSANADTYKFLVTPTWSDGVLTPLAFQPFYLTYDMSSAYSFAMTTPFSEYTQITFSGSVNRSAYLDDLRSEFPVADPTIFNSSINDYQFLGGGGHTMNGGFAIQGGTPVNINGTEYYAFGYETVSFPSKPLNGPVLPMTVERANAYIAYKPLTWTAGVSLSDGSTYRYANYSGTAALVSINGIAPVPEPSSWAMMIAGFAVVGLAARRNRRRKLSLA